MNAASERPYLWLVGLMALVGLVADQASKYVVFAKLYPGDHPYEVIPGYFDLSVHYSDVVDPGDQPLSFLRTISGEKLPHVNRGALFGIGNSGGWNTFFACISVAAAAFIVYWVRRPSVAQDRFLCLALGLILAGTLGNLYDRIVFGGVRDFIHWFYLTQETGPGGNAILMPHTWPDFNIADCCLVCGASVLLVHSFFVTEKTPDAKAEAATQATVPLQTTTPAGNA